MMIINIRLHQDVHIDGSHDQSAFLTDISCELIRGLNIDNNTGSFSRVESKRHRSCRDLLYNAPSMMVFEQRPPSKA